MPQENLITPDTVRRVCWEPPKNPTPGAVDTLAGYAWDWADPAGRPAPGAGAGRLLIP